MSGKLGLLKRKHRQGTAAQVAGKSAIEIKAELDGVSGVQTLALDQLCIDGGTQIRVGLSQPTINEYAEAIAAGANFPPLEAVFDGKFYWLSDGFHRLHAMKQNGRVDAAVNVTEGSKRDAILAGIKANATHGLRRTNADKKNAVQTLLSDSEWRVWSDREIARQCGVSDRMVNGYRAEFEPTAKNSQLRVGADGKARKAPIKTGQKASENKTEKTVRDGLKTYVKLTTKAKPEAVAQLTKGRDLEVAKQARDWLEAYIGEFEG